MRKFATAFALFFLAALAFPAAAQVSYGSTAAVGVDEVFVGEPGNVIEPGAVYVYRPASGGWQQTQRLVASNASDADGFGSAIAVTPDGSLLAIGAENSRSVYVFAREGASWNEIAVLQAEARGFGSAVAVRAGSVVVGAPGHGDGRGAVFVYRGQGQEWSLAATLEGDGDEEIVAGQDGEETHRPEGFGSALALDDRWMIVGAPGGVADLFLGGRFGNAPADGRAYVFRNPGSGWERADKLDAPNPGSMFGSAVALHDGQAMVGAEGADSFTGAVHAYRLDDEGSWVSGGRLSAFDAGPRANFGASIALGANDVLIGAPGAGTGRLEGRIYRFARDEHGEWTGATKLGTAGLKWGSTYGKSVAINGNIAVAGLPGDDFGAGSAVVMTRLDGGWDRSRVVSDARGLPAITGREVPCVNGMAGIFPCDNVDLVSFLPVSAIGGGRGVTTNDLWGWTDPETNRDYAVVGLRDGTAFVDVTDPLNPVFVGKLPKTEESPASLWRDVKVYDNFALIAADASGPHGVQVFDLTRLREFTGEPIWFAQDAHYAGTHSTHNLAVNSDTSFAYAVGNSAGGEACGGALHMINVEDPRNPVFAGCFQPPGPGGTAVGTHDTQCVTYHGPDERYQGREICLSSNGRAFSIGDVTDKRNPRPVALATYPNLAYTHQGWLDEEHEYFYMNDEGDEAAGLVAGTRTLIWDIGDLEDPILVGEYTTDNPATDHNLYIVGDVMYQSNYRSGLRVVDIADRENPRALGFFDTVPWGTEEGMGDIVSGAIGSWSNYPFFKSGVVAVTSGKEGLFLVRLKAGAERP